MTEYDERVKDYWKISGIKYIVKMIDDAGLEDEVKKLNTMLFTYALLYYQTLKEL